MRSHLDLQNNNIPCIKQKLDYLRCFKIKFVAPFLIITNLAKGCKNIL